ncbi:uncharacterized protein TRIADDRAFT_53582 [Trichoplax adhaerens]|uniref:UDP-glucuronosyltransferase n=1 Tax=Trichoplax adhaerens TaxID=10228 RepID=B3RPL4_TRIAD|nr:hypothetical protein TRIADDRAFT_53582 [Trichoplax adhaerens]EDV27655.1 hypothetical protein TRIADDRAFT_53582 [Trichoplax adhaerens]|eukprot:XP_002109489.1 hypothetical protein TRIADDRAFT_53582 [Trichoplax adhaerens]
MATFTQKYIRCLLLIASLMNVVTSIKVVLLPSFGTSHLLVMDTIGAELQNRGHEVVILVEEEQVIPSIRTATATYAVSDHFSAAVINNLTASTNNFEVIKKVMAWQSHYCDCVLSHSQFRRRFSHFDLMIGDRSLPCAYILPEILNLTYVIVSSVGLNAPMRLMNSPNPLAYIPQYGTGYSDKMNLLQRTTNTLVWCGHTIASHIFVYRLIEKLRQEYHVEIDASQLKLKPALMLISADFTLEFARPLMPNVQLVGPLTPQPPSALPHHLDDFISNVRPYQRFVLVSLGSIFQFSNDQVMVAYRSLSRLPFKVIWKHSSNLSNNISNDHIRIENWVPQNDLLGHPNIVAFITHCGPSGMYEGAYHGVPMIGLPYVPEQETNLVQISRAGIGIGLNSTNLTTDSIYDAVMEVVNNPSYKQNARRISKLLKGRPRTPRHEAVDWIELWLSILTTSNVDKAKIRISSGITGQRAYYKLSF